MIFPEVATEAAGMDENSFSDEDCPRAKRYKQMRRSRISWRKYWSKGGN